MRSRFVDVSSAGERLAAAGASARGIAHRAMRADALAAVPLVCLVLLVVALAGCCARAVFLCAGARRAARRFDGEIATMRKRV